MNPPLIVTGMLSFGKSGRNFHAPFLNAHPRFLLKAVVERSKKQAQALYPFIVSHDSIEELLQDETIQLVVVNTPDHLHFEHARAALTKGKHVLLEKPATINSIEIDELYRIADKQQKYLLVYQNRRWDTDFRSVAEILAGGRLGQPVEMHIRYDLYLGEDQLQRLALTGSAGGGDIVYGLGPHVIDQAISLFGEPVNGFKTSTRSKDNGALIYFSYVLKFKNGVTVFVSASLTAVSPQPAYLIHGTKGSYSKSRTDCQEAQLLKNIAPGSCIYALEQLSDKGILTTFDTDGSTTLEYIEAPKSSYMELFDALYAQIAYNKPFPVTREHIRWQIALLSKEDDL